MLGGLQIQRCQGLIQGQGVLRKVFSSLGKALEQIGIECHPQRPVFLPQAEQQQPTAAGRAPEPLAVQEGLAQAEQGAQQGKPVGQSIQHVATTQQTGCHL
ncbi:hypothetical protein D3C76_750530 [compost metagenome]